MMLLSVDISALDPQYELCAGCFHPKENHKNMDGTDKCICSGSITCTCDTFTPPFLQRFAQRIEQEKKERKTINRRVRYILEEIPKTRNAGEKTFAKIYKEIWHGVKIRTTIDKSTTVDMGLFKQIPHDDTINREKRRCKEDVALQTYDPKVIMEQTAIYQALMDMAIEK